MFLCEQLGHDKDGRYSEDVWRSRPKEDRHVCNSHRCVNIGTLREHSHLVIFWAVEPFLRNSEANEVTSSLDKHGSCIPGKSSFGQNLVKSILCIFVWHVQVTRGNFVVHGCPKDFGTLGTLLLSSTTDVCPHHSNTWKLCPHFRRNVHNGLWRVVSLRLRSTYLDRTSCFRRTLLRFRKDDCFSQSLVGSHTGVGLKSNAERYPVSFSAP